MLRGLFSLDNPVIKFFCLIGNLWMLNILWLVCSLPIVTLGASTTALVYSCMKLRADEGYIFRNFFKSFKENFKQSTILWLIYLVVGALLGLGLIFWNNYTMPGSKLIWGVVLAFSILYLISILYVFAIQSKFVNTIKNTIKYSFLIAFTHIKETILLALIVAGVVLANMFTIFLVNFITINVGMSIVNYWMSAHYQEIFEKYIPKKKYTSDDDYYDPVEVEDETLVDNPIADDSSIEIEA